MPCCRIVRWCSLGLVFAAALPAQRTWTVDRFNRAGADFTDLPAAVAAAQSGDAIFLRATSNIATDGYRAPSAYVGQNLAWVDGKSLRIVGETGGPPVRVLGEFFARNIPAGGFELSHLRFEGHATVGNVSIQFENCAGPLVMDHVEVTAVGAAFAFAPVHVWRDCPLVVVGNCTIDTGNGPWRVERSTAMLHDTTMVHSSPNYTTPISYAHGTIDAVDSQLWIVESTIEGPSAISASFSWMYSPALLLCRTDVRLIGATQILGGQSVSGTRDNATRNPGCFALPYPHVDWDTRSQLIGGQGNAITYSHAVQTGVCTQQTATTVTLHQHYYPLGASLMLIGDLLPAPIDLGLVGPVYVDPATAWSDLRLVLQAGPSTRSFAVPPGVPRGAQIWVQAFTWVPTGVYLTSNVTAVSIW